MTVGREGVNSDAYLRRLAADSAEIADVASGDLALPIPSCPGWSAGDLLLHLGWVYEWVGDLVESGATDQERDVKPIRSSVMKRRETREADPTFATSQSGVDWYREQADRLVKVLSARNPDEHIWTWWPPNQTAGFWQRRMALETVVHRWDVLSAFGREEPIDVAMARDGIEEVLYIHLPGEYEGSSPHGNGETYRFHCSDCNCDWIVHFDGDRIEVTEAQDVADLSFTGTASDVLLFLWRRISHQRLSVYGDTAHIDRYYQLLQVDS